MKKTIIYTALLISFLGFGQIPERYIPDIPANKIIGYSSNTIYEVRAYNDVIGDQSSNSDKIWEIQSNIDLATSTITIPTGVTLHFVGGSIKNGTINFGTNNKIIANPYDIFGSDNTYSGTVKSFTFIGQQSQDKVIFTKANPLMATYATFADDAAAASAGYPTGYMYMTSTGEFRIKL